MAADDPAPVSLTTPAYALLIDGSTVEIRSARPGDTEAVRAMDAALSPRNAYLRFAAPDGARAVSARIRLSPGQPPDPFLRRLR